MSRSDDDLPPDDELDRDDTTPPPGAEPTAAERARARAFGDLIDKVVAGRAPAAMPADDQPLVEVATVIRAATGKEALAPARSSAIVEAALARAIEGLAGDRGRARERDGVEPTTGGAHHGPAARPAQHHADGIIPLERGWRRRAPWLVAGGATVLAAAAAILLMLRGPERAVEAPTQTASAERAPLPLDQRSRAADALIGPIPRERSGDAVSRIDAIFADRLDGYRARTLSRPARAAPRGGSR